MRGRAGCRTTKLETEFTLFTEDGAILPPIVNYVSASMDTTATPVDAMTVTAVAVSRVGRLTDGALTAPFHMSSFQPTSNVHSAPIFVTLKNRPGVERSIRSRRIAQTWLARLEDIERVLAVENMEYLATKLELPNFDAVPRDVLMNNRRELLEEIQVAKDFFSRRSQWDEGTADGRRR